VNGAGAIKSMFGVNPTSGYRGPSHPLSIENPGSWHAKSIGAADMRPIKGMTFQQAFQRLSSQYEILEARDEVNNPSGHSTGPHWHFVLGKKR
jgi:hypothetical protein